MIVCRHIEDCLILYQLFLNQLKNERLNLLGHLMFQGLDWLICIPNVTDKEVRIA